MKRVFILLFLVCLTVSLLSACNTKDTIQSDVREDIGESVVSKQEEIFDVGEVTEEQEESEIDGYSESWMIDLHKTDYEGDLLQPIDSFTLNWQKTSDGWISDGENIDYLDYIRLYYDLQEGVSFSFSLYQRTLPQTEALNNYLNQMVTINYEGEVLLENADKANECIKIYINDQEQKIVKVSQGKGNGHIDYKFHIDTKSAKEDITKISVICK
ncbi:MAG: hypothetical protein IKL05_01070 [Clostridia bacterium]|nr:hypothetical protein [Clostridia bacterium]